MPLTALIHVLATKTLHFTRLDKFDDPFEGTWPIKDGAHWKSLEGFDVAGFTDNLKRSKAAACCWIECEYESAAMWDRYAFGRQGIGIKARYGTLKKAITPPDTKELWLFGMGRVEYFDHLEKGLIERLNPNDPLPNSLAPFMLKNQSYDYEHEVRILAVSHFGFEVPDSGLDFPIEPNDLIEEIVINPYAEEWFHEVAQDVAAKYNLTAKFSRSRLRPLR